MTINEYCIECNKIAREHGWWDINRSPLEVAALIMTELAEFCEEARSGNWDNMREELADVFIRLADYCGEMGVDIETEINKKMEKNRVRAYRHGGKKF